MRMSTRAIARVAGCGAAEQLVDPTRRNGHQRQCFGMSEIVRHVGDPDVIITDTGGTITVVFAPMKALRRTFYDLRTEGQGRGREACAIGVGLFIGCSPFYGFHLLLCWLVGRLLRLNRMKVYLAANVSNPIVAPLHPVRRASDRRVDPHRRISRAHARNRADDDAVAVRRSIFWSAALSSEACSGRSEESRRILRWVAAARDPFFDTLVRAAADRYVTTSITAWEFARGKLRGDPVYRDVLLGGWLPSGGRLLDIGCGQGLMLALLAEAERFERSGIDARQALPRFERLVGVELRPHRARLARAALGSDAEIVESDARTISAGTCRVVSAVRRAAHDAARRSGCAAGGCRSCARAGRHHSGS